MANLCALENLFSHFFIEKFTSIFQAVFSSRILILINFLSLSPSILFANEKKEIEKNFFNMFRNNCFFNLNLKNYISTFECEAHGVFRELILKTIQLFFLNS